MSRCGRRVEQATANVAELENECENGRGSRKGLLRDSVVLGRDGRRRWACCDGVASGEIKKPKLDAVLSLPVNAD